ncbi:MAG: polyphosphate polymerase domain-containing protein [Bacteroidia bacterium]|nr:polyphosphate polymerase domain-containing protein [Bacteroidia bacterium]
MDCIRLMNRIDTKYLLSAGSLPAFLDTLRESYKILEIEQKREFLYNTRYLDTVEMLFYFQHVTGKLARHKIRFRKYELTGKTFLEIKRKTNKNRTVKWRIENNYDAGMLDEGASLFIKKHLPFNSLALKANLDNKFTRVTLAAVDTRERITFDYCMSYTAMNGELADLPYLAIAELKSDGFPSCSPFTLTAKKMGFRPIGFSKYCMGNLLLRDLPKKNILKQKVLLLNKIENEYSKLNVS